MTTRFRPVALAAAVLSSACLLTAGPAHATVATEGTAVQALGDDVYRDWFTSHARCVTAGQGGIDRGHWGHYTCSEGDVFWHLWTDR
ncbi:hypothetical protein [Streptosporangium sp. NPDC020145]|uniref:hypothetical protein n=1 Tax=Streptosporangium sp. NPDC020145 TaxID=3154694 RepID=UPI00341D0D76